MRVLSTLIIFQLCLPSHLWCLGVGPGAGHAETWVSDPPSPAHAPAMPPGRRIAALAGSRALTATEMSIHAWTLYKRRFGANPDGVVKGMGCLKELDSHRNGIAEDMGLS